MNGGSRSWFRWGSACWGRSTLGPGLPGVTKSARKRRLPPSLLTTGRAWRNCLRLNRTGRKAIMRVGSILVLPPKLIHQPLFATRGRLGRESAAAQGDGLSRMRSDHMTHASGVRTPGGDSGGDPHLLRGWRAAPPAGSAAVGPDLRGASCGRVSPVLHAPAADHEPDPHQNHPAGAAADQSQRGPGRWGGAVDSPSGGRSRRVQARSRHVETAWLRTILHRLSRRGLVYAVEEFGEPHFHVMVRRAYADYTRRHGSPVRVSGC